VKRILLFLIIAGWLSALPFGARAADGIAIAGIAENSLFSPGGTASFSVVIDSQYIGRIREVRVAGSILRVVGRQTDAIFVRPPAANFSVSIPADARAGVYSLFLMAVLDDDKVMLSRPITLSVVPSNIESMFVEPDIVQLSFRGDARRLNVVGRVPGGGQQSLALLPELACSSSNSAVFVLEPGCRVRAIGEGVAELNVIYKSFAVSLPVRVLRTMRGDYDGDGIVTTMDVEALKGLFGEPLLPSGDDRDLNGDGKVNALDLRVLTTLCSYPRCASSKP